MGSSLFLEAGAISVLADKIVQARRLYGQDSSYVIGMLGGVEALLSTIDGSARTREQIHARILEVEGGKAARSAPESKAEIAPAGETLAENTWIKGVVKWFNNDKGYGFISTDSHIDVFVHWRDISSWDRSLSQGDEVEFMVTRTAKGFQAINVMKGGQEAEQGQSAAPGQESGEFAQETDAAPELEVSDSATSANAGGDAPETPVDGGGESETPSDEGMSAS